VTHPVDFVLTGAGELLTLDPTLGEGPLGVIRGGALAAGGGKIVWVGKTGQVGKALRLLPDAVEVDAHGRVVMPGFVDSHTHAIFAGSRERDFAQRARGVTYQEIAAAGGGILTTVEATREATTDELVALATRRLDLVLQHGTTTLEAKSGYGLTTADEVKILEAIRLLQEMHPVEIHPTFCGAHEVPPEYRENPDGYIDLVVGEMIPAVVRKRLAEYCDVFCDQGGFSVDQSRRVLRAWLEHGLRPKLHADEFAASGAAELAAEVGALSADHLLRVRRDGIRALKAAGVTATLLPGTAFFLGLPYAPARAFLEAGVRVALATDFNPGSSYTPNMQLVLTLACTQMRMSVEEAIEAATVGGAHALGLQAHVGALIPDRWCDLLVLDVPSYLHVPYLYGVNHVQTVVKAGQVVWPRA
jgi:imidazolonepropionase